MKLKELRWKKIIMALAAVVLTASDWMLVWHFDKPFQNSEFWNYWLLISSFLLYFGSIFFPLTLFEIIVVTVLGSLMGRDSGEKMKLILLGLIITVIAGYVTIGCLVYNEIPVRR
ncbi:MAG: hypothetical protein P4N59_25635 [Negativicutes bacterium]|nr:hypothetical protein [Negativicutes bacterium]